MTDDLVAGGRLIARTRGRHFRRLILTSRFLLHGSTLYHLSGLRMYVYENPYRGGLHWYVICLVSTAGTVSWEETRPFFLGTWRVKRLMRFAAKVSQAVAETETPG